MKTEIEKKIWDCTLKYLGRLRVVPFVKMIAVCNNFSFGKVDEKSDIDVFVIAKKGRLFFVRTFITLLLHIWGVRRHGHKIAGRFCLSFFIDDSFLDLSPLAIKNDIYLAYWIRNIVPIICEKDSYENFLNANLWIERYFINSNNSSKKIGKIFTNNNFLKRVFSFLFNGLFGNFVENRLRNWQLKRANKKRELLKNESGTILMEHILKFHNLDRRAAYRDKWYGKYGRNAKLSDEKFLTIL